MTRKSVDVTVIIPDASPVLTLARIDRLDLFDTFSAPIEIVDQVHYEITKPANDTQGRVAAWLARTGNRIARLPRVHLLNTAAWLLALADSGLLPDARQVLDAINAQRKSPMLPIERPGRTRRVQSRWMRKHQNDAG